jgi:hypothetical protein
VPDVLDSGGGGGGAVTPWYDYALPQMWQIVNGQDTDSLWKQATGWKNTTDLTSLHLYNLKEYKDQLVQAWPPERSEASAAYMAELDRLIASVQETHDAASANYDAVVSLALAAGDAKYKLKPLYDEYQSNQQKLAEYNQQVDAYNSDTTGLPQPSPGPSPVPNGRQDALNNQARSIMYSISSEITTAGAALKPPAPYKPPTPARDTTSGTPDSGGGTTGGGSPMLVPPVIPPVRPAPSPTPSGSGASAQPAPAAPPASPPPSAPPGIGQGPILGGAPAPAPPAPPGTQPPIIQPPPPPGPPVTGLPGVPPPTIGPTPPPYGTGPGLSPANGLIGPKGGPGAKPFGQVAGKIGRAMPPGGLIGGEPGAGLARPGGARPVSRVNPPGGVIGQQAKSAAAAGSRPGGTAAARAAGGRAAGARSGSAERGGPYAHSGRAGQRREEEESLQHWDPDNPWDTEEGVAPVVLPPAEPKRLDPGPSIGQGR